MFPPHCMGARSRFIRSSPRAHLGVVMRCTSVRSVLGGLCAGLTAVAVSGCSGGGTKVEEPPSAASSSPRPSSATSAGPSSTSSRPALKPDPVDTAFRAKVDAMCGSLLSDKVRHQPPDGYSVANPDPRTMAAVGAALVGQAITRTLVSTATALGSPSAAAASWTVVMRDFGAYENAAKAAVVTSTKGNPADFGSTLSALEGVKSTIRDDLRAIGLGNRSSCDLLFASGGGH